jgi:hypothetical protein
MSKNESCRFLAGALWFYAALALPHPARAAIARVQWLPRAAQSSTAYRVYVRDGGSTHVTDPQWSGSPAPAADGSLSALVPFTPAASGTNYFAVVAVNAAGDESALSGELPTGTPNPCRVDRCATKTSCDFGNRADGTPCDDVSYGNGREACLADACAQGECTASPGEEIAIDRMRFKQAKSSVKLAAKGRFIADPSIDLSLTGAVVELQTADGIVIYSSSIAAPSFTGVSAKRYHFTARRSQSDPLWNGLKRLDFKIKGLRWRVTTKAETPALATAFLEPSITLVIRLGTACVRRLDLPCQAKFALAICG